MRATLVQLVNIRSQLAGEICQYCNRLIDKLDLTPWFRQGENICAIEVAVPARMLKEPRPPNRLASSESVPITIPLAGASANLLAITSMWNWLCSAKKPRSKSGRRKGCGWRSARKCGSPSCWAVPAAARRFARNSPASQHRPSGESVQLSDRR